MKHRLLELLACPSCRQPLRLSVLKREVRPSLLSLKSLGCSAFCARFNQPVGPPISVLDCTECYQEEILEGFLWSDCGRVFPVIDGVPRLTLDAARLHAPFVVRYQTELAGLGIKVTRPLRQKELDAATRAGAEIRGSFGAEWKIFNYTRDRTWGMTREERKRKFLTDLQSTAQELQDKLVLDAGCGNGVSTAAVADFGAEVIGIDVAESVVRAQAQNTNPRVHYINANLLNPPFRTERFDIVYSSGVLHHTPNPEFTFSCLATLLRPGGRFWVWLYSPQPGLKRQVFVRLRRITSRLPLSAQYLLYTLMVPLALLKRSVLLRLKLTDEPKLNWREQLINFFDGLSPRYRFEFTPSEVALWFEKHGFSRMRITGTNNYGFGMYGDKGS